MLLDKLQTTHGNSTCWIWFFVQPKKAVVATIAALLVISANDQIKGVLPPDYILPEQENAVHTHWLGVQKAMGPKTLQCVLDAI